MNPMQGMNASRDMTFPMQGQGRGHNAGNKRYFGDELANIPFESNRFNPHPRRKNARLHSPPHRPQLDDSLLRDLRYLLFEQSGSCLLQQVLDEGGSTAATTILNEGLPFWADAMAHLYGNYLFQKIVECITPSERVTLMKSVSTRLVDASMSKHGNLSVRKIVEVCAREEAACNHIVFKMLTDVLGPYAVRLCVDTHATFVIQCILRNLPYQYTKIFFKAVADSIKDMACNRNGYFVVLCCLDSCHSEARTQVVKRIVELSGRIREVMMDPVGNYVAQKALSVATNEQATRLVESMRPYLSSQNNTNAGVRNILRQIYKRFPSFKLEDGASQIDYSTALVESSLASTSGAAAISGNANVSSALAAQPPSAPDGEGE